MKKSILIVLLAVLALGLVPVLSQAQHCPSSTPPAHNDVLVDPTGRHIFTTTSGTNVGSHSSVGWVAVGTNGVQGSDSGHTVYGSADTTGICLVGVQVP